MNTKAGRTGITYEQVVAAYNSLKADDIKPSFRAVREMLGSGSLGTISKHIATMKANESKVVATEITLPVQAQEVFVGLIHDGIERETAKALRALAEANEYMAELSTDNEGQAETIADQAARIEELEEQAQEQANKIEVLTELSSKAEASVVTEREASEDARKQLAKAEIRLEGMPLLQSDLAEAKTELKALYKDQSAANTLAARNAEKLEAAVATIADLKERMEATKAEAKVLKDEFGTLSNAIESASIRAMKAEAELEMMAKSEAKAEKEIERLRAQVESLNGEAKALREEAKADAKAKSTANKEGK